MPHVAGFSLIRKDRARNAGGGLALLIHHSIKFQELPTQTDQTMEEQCVRINVGMTSLDIHNVYIPPSSSCSRNHNSSIRHLFSNTTKLILGDFNAHDDLWYSDLSCPRGAHLAEEINDAAYGTLNSEGSCTRLPSNGSGSSPDISIASEDLLLSTTWYCLPKLSPTIFP